MGATDITFKIRGKSPLVGGGFDSSGSPVQAKRMTWGRIDISAYAAAGMDVSLADFGLDALDYLRFEVRAVDPAGGVSWVYPATTVHLDAQWADGTDKLFITDDEAEGTALDTNGTAQIYWFAIGDYAGAPNQL